MTEKTVFKPSRFAVPLSGATSFEDVLGARASTKSSLVLNSWIHTDPDWNGKTPPIRTTPTPQPKPVPTPTLVPARLPPGWIDTTNPENLSVDRAANSQNTWLPTIVGVSAVIAAGAALLVTKRFGGLKKLAPKLGTVIGEGGEAQTFSKVFDNAFKSVTSNFAQKVEQFSNWKLNYGQKMNRLFGINGGPAGLNAMAISNVPTFRQIDHLEEARNLALLAKKKDFSTKPASISKFIEENPFQWGDQVYNKSKTAEHFDDLAKSFEKTGAILKTAPENLKGESNQIIKLANREMIKGNYAGAEHQLDELHALLAKNFPEEVAQLKNVTPSKAEIRTALKKNKPSNPKKVKKEFAEPSNLANQLDEFAANKPDGDLTLQKITPTGGVTPTTDVAPVNLQLNKSLSDFKWELAADPKPILKQGKLFNKNNNAIANIGTLLGASAFFASFPSSLMVFIACYGIASLAYQLSRGIRRIDHWDRRSTWETEESKREKQIDNVKNASNVEDYKVSFGAKISKHKNSEFFTAEETSDLERSWKTFLDNSKAWKNSGYADEDLYAKAREAEEIFKVKVRKAQKAYREKNDMSDNDEEE